MDSSRTEKASREESKNKAAMQEECPFLPEKFPNKFGTWRNWDRIQIGQ